MVPPTTPASGRAIRYPPARRWPAVVVAGVGGLVVWIVAGAPWWGPAALLAGGLAGRLVATLLPARFRSAAVLLGAAAALGWLVLQLSPAGWLATAGLLVLIAVLLGVPRWLFGVGGPWDGRRLVAAAVAGALLVAGAVAALIEHDQAAAAQAEIDARAGDLSRAQMLPRSPAAAVQALLRAIAEDEPRAVCSAFTPAAAAQLATAHGAADCADAVHRLHAQVGDPDRYIRPDRGTVTEVIAPDGQTGTGDGCALTWTGLPALLDPGPSAAAAPAPGPAPGVLDGQRQLGQGFLVTRYEPCGP